ncbi:MAG: hypothetical protein IKH56_07780 [Oscillospiraceae bacterium]|nr:hypothetical protein [Oscillospiraceae bacterium]
MIRNWLRRVMMGRYGQDHLNVFLLIVAILLSLLAAVFRFGALSAASYLPLLICIFRMMSRNITARRKENDRFIRIWWPVRTKIVNFFRRLKDLRRYKYFQCSGCHCTLRVPRGKGKVQITCPKCGERSVKNT